MAILTNQITSHTTAIPGLLVFDIPTTNDERGYFQEKYQKAKLAAAGMPEDFNVAQNSLLYNRAAGVIRGFHAESWEKYISVAGGKVFAAYVDLRKGDNLGKTVTLEITAEKTVFLPRGVANSYQTLEPNTYYLCSVNKYWNSEDSDTYRFFNLADPKIGIEWPIPLDQAIMSERDSNLPMFDDIQPLEL